MLVHGYALGLDCWHFQRKQFRGRVRQVLYDQRSHGRSGHSAADHCRVPQLAEDLRQVLAELTDDAPVVLVGHSMGAMTIMHLASRYPELFGPQVKAVGLFSTSAGEMADYSPVRAIPGRAFSTVAPPLCCRVEPSAGAGLAHPPGRQRSRLRRHAPDGVRLGRARRLRRVRQRDAGGDVAGGRRRLLPDLQRARRVPRRSRS